MKRTISILMIAMMILTSGAFAAYANVDGDAADQVQATEETSALEEAAPAAEEQAEPAAEEAVVEEPEAVEEEAVAEETAEEGAEAEEQAEEVMAKPAKLAAPESFDVVATTGASGNATIEWTAEEGLVYEVFLDGKSVKANLTAGKYEFKALAAGKHTAIVVTSKTDEEGNPVEVKGTCTFNIAKWIANVAKVKVYGGYDSIHLYWTPVTGAASYKIYRATSKSGFDFSKPYTTITAANATKATKTNGSATLIEQNPGVTFYTYKNSNSGTTYYYKVLAVDSDGKTVSADSPVDYGSRIKYITYDFTLKTKKTLKSHDGKNKKVTFPKGFRVKGAVGFGGGKYRFYYKVNGKSYYFYCTQISTKAQKANYKKSGNYSKIAAELYANDVGFKSSTKYMIWTSLYCQHTYIYQKVDGKWKCIRDFECGSGSAKLPSPSGASKELISGPGTEKKPGKRAKRHNRKYWSPYSAWNSYHAKLTKQTLGYPASKGCIRTNPDDAYFIYKSIPVHTRVAVL